jgi:branched-chain amino acid transport system permease protein
MFYHVSGEAVVWAIVGGAGTIFGPLVGTSLFIVMREELSTYWEHHPLLVGLVAILVVIFAPRGIVGLWNSAMTRFTRVKVEEVAEKDDYAEEGKAPQQASDALRV